MFKWVKGRQNSGYDKLLLATSKWPLPFDIYLLRFTVGSEINWHIDPVQPGKKHWRFNLVLKRAELGGNFITEFNKQTNRINIFRPDITFHKVTRVLLGTRYVLSIGFLL